MPYPGFFAPLERQHRHEAALEHAAEDLITRWEEGSWTPCRRCAMTVEHDQLIDIDPCDSCVEAHARDLEQEAAERYADAVMEDRLYELHEARY